MFKKYSNKQINENTNLDKLRNILGNKNIDSIKNIQDNLIFDKNLAQKRLDTFLKLIEINDISTKLLNVNIIKEDLEDNIYIIDIIGNMDIFYEKVQLNAFLEHKYLDIDGKESINLVNINYSNINYTYYFDNLTNYNIKYDKLIPKISVSKNGINIVSYNNSTYNNESIYYCNKICFDNCNIKNLNNIENIFDINNIDNIKYLTPELKNEYKNKIIKTLKSFKDETYNEKQIYISNHKNEIIIPSFNTKIYNINIHNSENFIIKNNNIAKLTISTSDKFYDKNQLKITEDNIKKGLENNKIKTLILDDIFNITTLNFGGNYKELYLYKTINLKSLDGLSEECKVIYIEIDTIEMAKIITNKKSFDNLCDFLINKRKNELTLIIELAYKYKRKVEPKIIKLIEILKQNNLFNNMKKHEDGYILKFFISIKKNINI